MIGDDDFFMQNSDYHYGASDVEKMYGRSYNNDSALIGGYDSSSSGRYESSSSASSGNDTDYGKYCLVGLMIFIAIILMVAVVVPAVTESMANSVTIEDLNITRYIHSSQYDSKVYSDTGYDHVTNLIFYSKKGKVLHNDSEYIGEHHLEDVPYYVDLDEKADYAVFEVYRNNKYGKCIYRERVDVDNKNVKKEFINYDSMYYG